MGRDQLARFANHGPVAALGLAARPAPPPVMIRPRWSPRERVEKLAVVMPAPLTNREHELRIVPNEEVCALVRDRVKLADDLVALDAALRATSLRIREAEARRRFLAPPEALHAIAEHARLLTELDRLMTRIRAVEAKLSLLDRGHRLPFE